MKVRPVINPVKPKYPDKYEIELNKALLCYHPKRWLKEPLIGLTLVALTTAGALGLSGCGRTAGDMLPPNINYISDADALSIIADELENAGYGFASGGDNDAFGFEFDGRIIDGGNKIDLEYVSKEDCADKKYPDINYKSYCDPKAVAGQLKDVCADAAIFCDPEEYANPEEALRAQVLDFLEWLISAGAEA